MTAIVPVRAGLDAPHDRADPRLERAVAGFVRRRGPPPDGPSGAPAWTAVDFGLDRVATFRTAPAPVQGAIVAEFAAGLIAESYFVEKCGLAYCAKAVLLAETTDARQAFSLLAADEATHLAWLAPHLDTAARSAPEGGFLALLARQIEQAERQSLILMLQVVLEGWGLTHYRRLAESCRDPGLADAFRRIARDEALHHETGCALFDAAALAPAERVALVDAMAELLGLVAAGPQRIATAIARALGGLSQGDAAAVFEQLDGERSSADTLLLLRSLIDRPGLGWLVAKLEENGLFRPMSPERCAAVLRA